MDREFGSVTHSVCLMPISGPGSGSVDFTDDLRLAHVLADDADSITQNRFKALDLHVSVEGLVTRIIEESPMVIRRSGARLAGLTTSPAKAVASARNGRLGGRPKSKPKTVQHG